MIEHDNPDGVPIEIPGNHRAFLDEYDRHVKAKEKAQRRTQILRQRLKVFGVVLPPPEPEMSDAGILLPFSERCEACGQNISVEEDDTNRFSIMTRPSDGRLPLSKDGFVTIMRLPRDETRDENP